MRVTECTLISVFNRWYSRNFTSQELRSLPKLRSGGPTPCISFSQVSQLLTGSGDSSAAFLGKRQLKPYRQMGWEGGLSTIVETILK